MSALYEMGFFTDFKHWIRIHRNGKSEITSDFSQKWECYVPSNNGEYKSIYDGGRYTKQYGNSKFANENVSPISPSEVELRERYRGRYNREPRVMYLDIETRVGTCSSGFPSPDKALEPVSLIQFLDSKTEEVFIIGLQPFYYKEHYLKDCEHKVNYIQVKDEIELFDVFFRFLEKICPLIVYAWNGSGFDFPYLYNRCKRLGISDVKFSPFWRQLKSQDLVKLNEFEINNFYEADLKVPGIFYIDMKKLYRKFVLAPRPSYSLQSIAEVELNCGKIDHSEFVTFDDFYQGNYTKPSKPTEEQTKTLCYELYTKYEQTGDSSLLEEVKKAGHGQFIWYGVIDVVLLYGLDKKISLTPLMAAIAERLGSQFIDVMGTVKQWGTFIRNHLHDRGLIIVPREYPDFPITGGYVRDPVPGKQKWVISADVNSMYPMLSISGSNMSPETYRSYLDVGGELKDFCIKYLGAGGDNSQDETKLLEVLEDAALAEKLKSLLEAENLVMAPNSAFFKKDNKGLIPELVENIYAERKSTKKREFIKDQAVIYIDEILEERGEA